MKPVTRLETLVQAIIEGSDLPFSAVDRIEMFLSDIISGQVSSIAPATRLETYLAKISGQDIDIPTPITRIECFLAAIAGRNLNLPIPITRLEMLLNVWADSASSHTISGPIISFLGKSSTEILGLSVALAPVQDLHGYDHPWPAGGGKNLLDTQTAITQTASNHGLDWTLSNNVFSVSGTTSQNYCSVRLSSLGLPSLTLPAGTYKLYVFGLTGNFDPRLTTATYSEYIRPDQSTTLTEETTFSILASSALGTGTQVDGSFKLMVVDTSTGIPTVWTPYSNICPITGFTGANIYVSPTQDQQDATVYNVDWTSETGTVYGGTLDVTTGKLTVTMASVDMGTLSWQKSTSAGHERIWNGGIKTVVKKPDTNNMKANIVCSIFDADTANNTYSHTKDNTVSIGTDGVIYCYSSSIYDEPDVGTALSGVQLVYELATPVEYTLTPQEAQTLVGQNYVWSDAGDVSVTVKNIVPQ